jgi:hypothetical protein
MDKIEKLQKELEDKIDKLIKDTPKILCDRVDKSIKDPKK